jgi:hypothetical protein
LIYKIHFSLFGVFTLTISGELRKGFAQGVNGHDFEAEESFISDFFDGRFIGHCEWPAPKSTRRKAHCDRAGSRAGTSGRTGA